MASKRRLRRRQCEGKAKHSCKDHAVLSIKKIKANARLGAYKCSFCGSWHVGRTKQVQLEGWRVFLK